MSKKDTLYTVNKWNKPLFAQGVDRENNNIFDGKDSSLLRWDQLASQAYGANYGFDGNSLDSYMNSSGNNWFGISKKNNLFSKGNIGSTMNTVGNAANLFGDAIVGLVSNGYNAGNGFNGALSAVRKINTGNPLIDGVKNLASTAIQAVGNLGFGIKKNEKNINALNENVAAAKSAGNAMAGATTSGDFMNNAGQMTSSLGFGSKDLVKGGWWRKGKARKMNQEYLDKETAALAQQNQGMMMGAQNVDSYMDDAVMSNFAAYGGPIGPIGLIGNNNGMGAIEYGFMSDYLDSKNKQTENKGTNSLGNLAFANGYASGGKIHIKKSHQGRLTKLKKRTGKTEAELYNDGNPAHKKMVVFARNARKWKKAYGGFLDAANALADAEGNMFDGGGKKDNWLKNAALLNPSQMELLNDFSKPVPVELPEQEYPVSEIPAARLIAPAPPIKAINDVRVLNNQLPIEERYRDALDYNNKLIEQQAEFNRGVNQLNNNTLFAIGGDMQTNGADYSTGLTHINAGGSHEENPYEGVQMGVDQEGTPNLVEEGEVVYNDYVYSQRITLDPDTKKKFHFPKKSEITYADAAKKLEKEIKERPNDPISQAAFKAQMEDLAEQQERQKQEMEAQRAQEAFDSLSDEEKVGVMQYAQQQEQAAQQQAMQQQAMAQQAQMQQAAPQEMAIQEQMMAQPESPMAFGGQLHGLGGNLFAGGGELYDKFYSYLADKGYTENVKKEIAQAMVNRATRLGHTSSNVSPRYIYNDFLKGLDTSEKGYERNYNEMRRDGMSRAAATAYFQTERKKRWGKSTDSPYQASLAWEGYTTKWEDARSKTPSRRRISKQEVAATPRQTTTSSNASVSSSAESAAQVSQPVRKKTRYKSASGRVFDTNAEAAADEKAYYAEKRAAAAQKQQAPDSTITEVATPARAATNADTTNTVKDNSTGKGRAYRVGDYAREGDQWSMYGLPGFQHYINTALADYALAEDKNAAAQKIADTINGIQQSFNDYIAPTIGNKIQYKDANVGNHQKDYHTLTNNAGFKRFDDGHEVDLTDEAINKPEGYDTTDNLAGGFVDDLSGPQTWLRYFGATGDESEALKDIIGKLNSIGIDYSPYANWTIGSGDTARQLYRASLMGAAPAAVEVAGMPGAVDLNGVEFPEDATQFGDGNPYTIEVDENPGEDTFVEVDENGNPVEGYDVVPIHRNEKWRYAGLFGPAVGLGMQALGIGKPNTKALDGILEAYDKTGAALADYKPIGNYVRYTPMDIWAEQNRLNANTRATDRALANNAAPIGTRAAGLLANEYNNQIGSGNLYRNALEYNNNNMLQAATFNRGTDQFNAEAYNRAALQNASIRNHDRQLRAQLGMQAAAQKAAMDSDWYNGIYGNVAGIFKGIGDIGRENAQHNMIADMAATGIFGTLKNQPIANGFVEIVPRGSRAAKGGKINKRKGKKGLTF